MHTENREKNISCIEENSSEVSTLQIDIEYNEFILFLSKTVNVLNTSEHYIGRILPIRQTILHSSTFKCCYYHF